MKILTSGIAWNDPKLNSRISYERYFTYAVPSTARPNISAVSLYDQLFEDPVLHNFPLTPMLKFQSITKILVGRLCHGLRELCCGITKNFKFRS